jgi:hypothetical protein
MNPQELPLPVRCKNPGDLRIGIPWEGLAPVQSDPSFCTFISATYGFRALAIDLHTKWAVDGLRTIEAIITKYAPPSENNTLHYRMVYIGDVAAAMGVAMDAVLDLNSFDQLRSFCRAIATHEAGFWAFAPWALTRGVNMALAYVKAPKGPVA